MFSLSGNLQYYLFTGSTDMRKGFDALSGVVRSQMGRDPLSGEVFIFVNRSRNTVKILHWERGGLVIYHKRLEAGRFERPHYDEQQNAFRMRWSELVMMIEGVSMKQTVYRKRYDLDHASRPAKSSVSTTWRKRTMLTPLSATARSVQKSFFVSI